MADGVVAVGAVRSALAAPACRPRAAIGANPIVRKHTRVVAAGWVQLREAWESVMACARYGFGGAGEAIVVVGIMDHELLGVQGAPLQCGVEGVQLRGEGAAEAIAPQKEGLETAEVGERGWYRAAQRGSRDVQVAQAAERR